MKVKLFFGVILTLIVWGLDRMFHTPTTLKWLTSCFNKYSKMDGYDNG